MLFHQEIKILHLLNFKFIVSCYDIHETDEEIYICMELVNGGDLFDFMRKSDSIPEKTVALVCDIFVKITITSACKTSFTRH